MKGLPQLHHLVAGLVVLTAAAMASARQLNMQHYDPSDCTRHEMLYGQIHQDLMPWALKGIRPENMNVSRDFCAAQSGLFVCVLIEDGQVYLTSLHDRSPHGVSHMVMLAAFLVELYEVSVRYRLPDMEFALYTGDQPFKNMKNTSDLGSDHILLAYSKRWDPSEVSPEILIPFSGHFRCFPNAFDTMLARVNDFSHTAIPWEGRKQVGITRFNTFCPATRGRFAMGEQRPCAREVLPEVSNSSGGALDAYSVLASQHLSMEEHAGYRYLVSTDGWTASSKLEKYLLMGSTVLKQVSPMIAYYYAAMIPWVHYVPFYEYHKADILGVISWLKENDDAAKEMSKNAQRFARLHLNRPARLCYYHELFNRMGKLFRYKPSCKDQPMCVPLLDELKYMGWFTAPGTSSGCDIHRQLDEIHGKVIDKGARPEGQYGDEKFFHGHKNHSSWRVDMSQFEF